MDFGFNFRYAFLNEKRDRAYVNASFGWEVELTNSDTTTQQRELRFRDTGLSLGYSHVVFESDDKETRTTPLVSVGTVLPTSLASRSAGKYLTTNVGLGIVHSQKLAGSKHDWFPDVLLFGTAGWSHLFSRATTPTNEGTYFQERERQQGAFTRAGTCDPASGNCTVFADQMTGSRFAENTMRFNFTYYLSIYKDILSLGNTWEVSVPFKRPFSDTYVQTSTGPVKVAADPNAPNGTPLTTFDVSLSYAIPSNLGRVDLGYQNIAGQIGEDGKRRGLFYSPDSMFYLNLAVYFDGVADKIIDAAKKKKQPASNVAQLPRFRNPLSGGF
jgi:hypothetical protein